MMRNELSVAALAVGLSLSPALWSQSSRFTTLGNGLRVQCVEVPGALGVCAVLGVGVGVEHDPSECTGLAQVLGECVRLFESERAAGEGPDVDVHVSIEARATVIGATAGHDGLDAVLERMRALLGGEYPIDDDLARRAAARAALAADDATHVYPGSWLTSAARRALLAGTPAARPVDGRAAQIEQLLASPTLATERYRTVFRPRNAVLAVLGDFDPADVERHIAGLLGALPAGDAPAAELVAVAETEPVATEAAHDRLSAPYVSLAVSGPEAVDDDWVAFLVAAEALRSSLARAFRYQRGYESAARFPPLIFDEWAPRSVVMVNRRAHDGGIKEGPRHEIEETVDTLLAEGFSQAAVARAAAMVSRRFELPPYVELEAIARGPRGLHPKAAAIVLTELYGWPTDLSARLRRVSQERANAALRAVFARDRWNWLSLVPRS